MTLEKRIPRSGQATRGTQESEQAESCPAAPCDANERGGMLQQLADIPRNVDKAYLDVVDRLMVSGTISHRSNPPAATRKPSMGSLDRSRLPDPLEFYECQGIEPRGKGVWRDARCPLHGGSSFRINATSGAFACMGGCDFRGGDVIAFLMHRDGLDFVEACRQLGAWVDNGNAVPTARDAGPKLPTARELLALIQVEVLVVYLVANDFIRNGSIGGTDMDRLRAAVRRIETIFPDALKA